ncbi:uncharacterized protein LOC143891066 [Tasmannia lanceolata]|uniref:uncharacterized protein LOC143891066 n=1 Tax=Tasmannia lanceolata TaxID=3420 RepID=UPI0040639D69
MALFSIRQMSQDFVKLESFDEGNFKRWQKKVHFILTLLKVVQVLTTPKPVAVENETLAQAHARMKWEQDDYICKGHILSAMLDTLFDIYQGMVSASEIWNALEAKYTAEDASNKKFSMSRFLNYRMVDDRPFIDQLHEIQQMVGQIHLQGILLYDSFIILLIINKLLPSWKNFRKSHKHKKEEISFDDLAQCSRIEEESRIRDHKEDHENSSSKIHLVKNVNKSNQQGTGHYKSECRLLKDKKSGTPTDNNKFVAMISEANILEEGNDW